jgi:hypothetical protein
MTAVSETGKLVERWRLAMRAYGTNTGATVITCGDALAERCLKLEELLRVVNANARQTIDRAEVAEEKAAQFASQAAEMGGKWNECVTRIEDMHAKYDGQWSKADNSKKATHGVVDTPKDKA